MTKLLIAIAILLVAGFIFFFCSSKLTDFAQQGYRKNLDIVGLTNTMFDKAPAEWQFKVFGCLCVAFAIIIALIALAKR